MCVHAHAYVCMCVFRMFGAHKEDIVKVSFSFLLIKIILILPISQKPGSVWISRKIHY